MGHITIKRAQELMTQGLRAVRFGHLQEARENFRKSAEFHETADAITYWAWMEHQLGNTALAIELCKKAIHLDPEFGNPYNDLGSYLMSLGQWDEAIPWLKRAIQSKRYDSRHYPHVNLLHVFEMKNMPMKAIRECKLALEFVPGDKVLVEKLDSLRKLIN